MAHRNSYLQEQEVRGCRQHFSMTEDESNWVEAGHKVRGVGGGQI